MSQRLSSLINKLLRTKSVNKIIQEYENHDFRRTLTALDLMFMGIGGIIGTGIYVLSGEVAGTYAGPAVVVSFVIASLVAGLAALCYAEMASMLPVSGSAYTYVYATMGELCAWIIGWDLILEYLVGSAAISVGLSGYLISFVENVTGSKISRTWTQPPFDFSPKDGSFQLNGNFVNLPALASVLTISFLLIFGIKESARLNFVNVLLKLFVVLFFIVAGISHVDPQNWDPFIPPNTGAFGKFGVSGVFQGATIVFFSFIGFDAVSTTAQECINPQRDMPIGILGSLSICAVLYVGVSLVLTGLVPYTDLNVPNPISLAISATGISWMTTVVEVGAICGLLSVLLINLLGQPRVFYAMATDGLLPKIFAQMHPKYKTPWLSTVISGVFCSILAGFLPLGLLGQLTSIGTLFAFVLVAIGVMILRLKKPDLPRPFKLPYGPYLIPLSSALASFGLILASGGGMILRLVVWMAVGLAIYAAFGYRKSKLHISREALYSKSIIALTDLSPSDSNELLSDGDELEISTRQSVAPDEILSDFGRSASEDLK